MPPPIDISGRKFGRLTAKVVVKSGTGRLWSCQCDCGKTIVSRIANLINGNTTSCGCKRSEKTIARNSSHGLTNSSEYSVWCAMKKRCNNPKDDYYYLYGGRGIKVCERWADSFEAFLEDMGPRPSLNHSIDRRRSNEDYEPGNCRWATALEQSRNTSRNRLVVYRGQRYVLSELAEKVGVDYHSLKYRLSTGMATEEAIDFLKKD